MYEMQTEFYQITHDEETWYWAGQGETGSLVTSASISASVPQNFGGQVYSFLCVWRRM